MSATAWNIRQMGDVPSPARGNAVNMTVMSLRTDTARSFIEQGFGGLLRVADRLGDELVAVRPVGPDTTSVAALVVHCCGVTEYWLGHVALGRPSDRDRESEFCATASVEELHDRVASVSTFVADCLERLGRGEGTDPGHRPPLWDGHRSDAAIVLHVIEELFQHLGHAELSADVLLGCRGSDGASEDTRGDPARTRSKEHADARSERR